MANQLNLKIVTPERIVCQMPIVKLMATATDGELGILPDHEPIVTALAVDAVKFETANHEEHFLSVIGGILEVENNNVTILTDIAELDEEIDLVRANQAKEKLEALKAQTNIENLGKDRELDLALLRAITRIKVHELGKVKKTKPKQ